MEGIRLVEREERYSEVAECWESLFHLAVGWGEHERAMEAGKGWVKELGRTGERLDGPDMDCVKHPEITDGWCRFIEREEIVVSPRSLPALTPALSRLMESLQVNLKVTVKMISSHTGVPIDDEYPGRAQYARRERDRILLYRPPILIRSLAIPPPRVRFVTTTMHLSDLSDEDILGNYPGPSTTGNPTSCAHVTCTAAS